MGIYSARNEMIDEQFECSEEDLVKATMESMLYDDMMKMTLEQQQMFIQSDEYKALEESKLTGAIGKNTIVKLSKSDDMERRVGLAALNIAREKNDGLWVKLMKNRQQEKKLLKAINKKYESQAGRVAKKAQKEYLKTHRLAVGFMRK